MTKPYLSRRFTIGRFQVCLQLSRLIGTPRTRLTGSDYKLHFGPGVDWSKPGPEWLTIDIDPERADILMDFNAFTDLPLPDNSVNAIYGSHVFEHISIFSAPKVFSECFRVLKPGSTFRLVLPDVRKSIEEYIKGNRDFPLFLTRERFATQRFGHHKFTIFQALKGDFLSPTGQPVLLGENGLAHQNAWDYESIVVELERAGFDASRIQRMQFQQSVSSEFDFEGTYPSEANESFRSLYVDATR